MVEPHLQVCVRVFGVEFEYRAVSLGGPLFVSQSQAYLAQRVEMTDLVLPQSYCLFGEAGHSSRPRRRALSASSGRPLRAWQMPRLAWASHQSGADVITRSYSAMASG